MTLFFVAVLYSLPFSLIFFSFHELTWNAMYTQPVQIQRLRNELKSYVGRHDLSEFGESVKELFERYNISDHQEQAQVSETCSHVLPEDTTRSSDDEVHSSLSVTGTRKLRPRSLNADAAQVSIVTESTNKETSQRKNTTAIRTRGSSLNKNTENSRTVSDTGGRRVQKKPQKGSKEETTKMEIKKQEKKSAAEEGKAELAHCFFFFFFFFQLLGFFKLKG